MCQAVLSPNLTKKFQWEVSQIADNRFPSVMLLGGLSVNLNDLITEIGQYMAFQSHLSGWFQLFATKIWEGGGDLQMLFAVNVYGWWFYLEVVGTPQSLHVVFQLV